MTLSLSKQIAQNVHSYFIDSLILIRAFFYCCFCDLINFLWTWSKVFFFHFRKWPIYTDRVSSHYMPLFTCSVERAQAEQLCSKQAWNTSPNKGNHKHERNCKICLLITRSELAKHYSFGLLKNLKFTRFIHLRGRSTMGVFYFISPPKTCRKP